MVDVGAATNAEDSKQYGATAEVSRCCVGAASTSKQPVVVVVVVAAKGKQRAAADLAMADTSLFLASIMID
jgi:D-alanyl-D-alanine carboxypeptidase